ncbi:MAG: hypothetical protein LC105_11595 [Chitinophagales bacterium]|nr:hypothetical protein [Chitinophagales bacterium]MCZ2394492.1 hypothetical protein [Chitinophagales bacterium]
MDWLQLRLQPLVERKFVLQDSWQLEKIEHKGIKLPYVQLENKSIVLNKFRIPIRLESIHLLLLNKGLQVGKVIYDSSLKLAPQSQNLITMEVQMNHITAFFQVLRLTWRNSISLDVKGEIHIRLLGMDFFIPVIDKLDMPKSKLKMFTSDDKLNTSEEIIAFEELTEAEESLDAASDSKNNEENQMNTDILKENIQNQAPEHQEQSGIINDVNVNNDISTDSLNEEEGKSS